jgi:hypothetical protein
LVPCAQCIEIHQSRRAHAPLQVLVPVPSTPAESGNGIIESAHWCTVDLLSIVLVNATVALATVVEKPLQSWATVGEHDLLFPVRTILLLMRWQLPRTT